MGGREKEALGGEGGLLGSEDHCVIHQRPISSNWQSGQKSYSPISKVTNFSIKRGGKKEENPQNTWHSLLCWLLPFPDKAIHPLDFSS